MASSLKYWRKVYEDSKDRSVCVDIERAWFNGPIAIVGVYRPREGVIECEQFVRGKNLTAGALRAALYDAKLLITYNGLRNDVPAIEAQFPGAIAPDRRVLDLYLLSRIFQVNASLKTWEDTLGIPRAPGGTIRKGHAIRLWQRYEQRLDAKALAVLLEYNRQDTVNLYPVAEAFLHGFVGD